MNDTLSIPVIIQPSTDTWATLTMRPSMDLSSLEQVVSPVIERVRREGDEAVRHFTLQFDKADVGELQVASSDIQAASGRIAPELKRAIELAIANISAFHQAQVDPGVKVETMPGVHCWRRPVAIQSVGLYIPGGSAPLFSTILMLALPAVIAGCTEIVLCSPPDADGQLHPAILYAARRCGVTNIFRVGGVQAIAAMAFGTGSIPKVNKIFGPGNQYVTCAKQIVQRLGIAIDMPAGPSEVAVFADASADADFVAADLLSQAEHGVDSHVLLVTTDQRLANATIDALNEQIKTLPRRNVASKSLSGGKIVVVETIDEAFSLLNLYAPEHLIISSDRANELAALVVNAGSVFLGHYSPESAGDYASGTNHTLPTNGYATAYSGVSVDSFVRKITYQELSREGLAAISEAVQLMAAAEGLDGHAKAVQVRLQKQRPGIPPHS